jgi:acyl-CoA thioesterase-1
MRTVTPEFILPWIVCLFLTCVSVGGFAATDVAGDNHDTDSKSPRILVMGDSLSAAYNIPREAGWVNLLRDKLQAVLPGAIVTNRSVSGATTAAGLQLLPEHLQTYRPNLVILELGANDGLQGKPIPYITANLKRLIELSQQAGAEVILVGVRLPPNYGTGYTQPFFNQYADLSRDYALTYVPFILEGVAGRDELMQEDGLHPEAQAQPQVLANLWPAVIKALQLPVERERVSTTRE